jgi:hypothetical protein
MDEIDREGFYAGDKDPALYNKITRISKRYLSYIEERSIFDDAEKYSLMYENENWRALGISRADHLTTANLAIAMDIVETITALITNRSPMPSIEPIFDMSMEIMQTVQQLQEAGEEEKANKVLEEAKEIASQYSENMEREFIDIWLRTKMPRKVKMGCRENLKVGNFFIKSEYNMKTGEIDNNPLALWQVLCSPNAESIAAHKDEPLIVRYVMSLEKVQRIYKIHPEAIRKAAIGDFEEKENKIIDKKTGFAARIKGMVKSITNRESSDESSDQRGGYVIVYECYMPDRTEVEYDDEVLDDKGQRTYEEWDTEKEKPITEKAKRFKYASGSKRVTIIKDHKGYIIQDQENMTEDGAPPIFGTTNFPQLGDVYGISEIAPVADIIRRINTAISNIIDNLKMTGNPKLEVAAGSKDINNGPVTNEIGGVVKSPVPGGVRYIPPPSLGTDVWKLLEWVKGWLDRQTKLSDAARGFNEFAGDSGKKIRELKMAARGGLQPKLDEQVSFSLDLFKHWLWIYQNKKEDIILQKVDTVAGVSRYSKFDTVAGRGLKFRIQVSEDSILPDDPHTRFEIMVQLYTLGLERTGEPLVSAQMLIKYAPELKERQTLIKNVDDRELRNNLEMQREEALKEYIKLVDKLLENLDDQKVKPGAFGKEVVADPDEKAELVRQENLILDAMSQLVLEYYELLSSDATASLPDDMKEALVTLVSEAVMEKKLVVDEPKEQLKELEKAEK